MSEGSKSPRRRGSRCSRANSRRYSRYCSSGRGNPSSTWDMKPPILIRMRREGKLTQAWRFFPENHIRRRFPTLRRKQSRHEPGRGLPGRHAKGLPEFWKSGTHLYHDASGGGCKNEGDLAGRCGELSTFRFVPGPVSGRFRVQGMMQSPGAASACGNWRFEGLVVRLKAMDSAYRHGQGRLLRFGVGRACSAARSAKRLQPSGMAEEVRVLSWRTITPG